MKTGKENKAETIKVIEEKLKQAIDKGDTSLIHEYGVMLDVLKGKNPYPLRRVAHWSILVFILFTTSSCKSVFVWTMGDVIGLAIVGLATLFALIAWAWMGIENLITKWKKK